jgi:hypothetical protein
MEGLADAQVVLTRFQGWFGLSLGSGEFVNAGLLWFSEVSGRPDPRTTAHLDSATGKVFLWSGTTGRQTLSSSCITTRRPEAGQE